jgi:hypothetical protein
MRGAGWTSGKKGLNDYQFLLTDIVLIQFFNLTVRSGYGEVGRRGRRLRDWIIGDACNSDQKERYQGKFMHVDRILKPKTKQPCGYQMVSKRSTFEMSWILPLCHETPVYTFGHFLFGVGAIGFCASRYSNA